MESSEISKKILTLRKERGMERQRADNTSAQRGASRIAPLGAVAVLIALAGLATAQYPDHDDRDRDYRHDRPIVVGREQVAIDFGGGNGGRPSPDAQCPPNFVATGFFVQTGEFFNQAWLSCAPIRPDGRLGRRGTLTGRTGSPGGRPVHRAACPENFALRGLRGRTGGSIDEAAGECTPLREIAERNDRPRTEFTEPITIPHPGGHPAAAECPLGSVVTGFRSTSGDWMDHLWVLCSELHHEHRDRDHDR
jgi:hypothetical protein